MDDKHQDELVVCISGLSNQKSSESKVGRKKLYDQTKIVSKQVHIQYKSPRNEATKK